MNSHLSFPFWSWNDSVKGDELPDQLAVFKEMGCGGAIIHVRQGLKDPYLGEEFLHTVEKCVQKAAENGLFIVLYDDDRWPSGSAGGKVSESPRHRLKYLLMTETPRENSTTDKETARLTGRPLYLGSFTVAVDPDGLVRSYEKTVEAPGVKNFYVITKPAGDPRYNGYCYADTLSGEACERFIRLTHEVYKTAIGRYFGTTIPAVFTDELQTERAVDLPNPFSHDDAKRPWTTDFDETYEKTCGETVTDKLPELFFFCKDRNDYATRLRYYRHVSERFCGAYMDKLAAWCAENGLALCGHVLGEDTLWEMTQTNADPMRAYRDMQLPGIDVLYDDRNFTAAVQCRSVARQYGKQWMLSEMYGVTGWDFDFRDQIFQGDWQAALGVTVRVPHLAWQTARGEGKRDYPASIFYQSPWYRDYHYLEDHYARIAAAFEGAEDVCRVAVLHPVESYQMLRAAASESAPNAETLEKRFHETCAWLLTGGVDFDYVAESLAEDLRKASPDARKLGKRRYDAVLLDGVLTLRPSTLAWLGDFASDGGKIVVAGQKPALIDGVPSDKIETVLAAAETVEHEKSALLAALSPYKTVDIRRARCGARTDDILFRLAEKDGERVLFLANARKPALKHLPRRRDLAVTVCGVYGATLLDTLTGKETPLACADDGRTTTVSLTLYDFASLLVRLKPSRVPVALPPRSETPVRRVPLHGTAFSTSEPNVLLLDMARFSLDGEPFGEREEILRIDDAVRTALDLPLRRRAGNVQPYARAHAPCTHTLTLQYTFTSEVAVTGASLAAENREDAVVTLNGAPVPTDKTGWYIDRHIETVALPPLAAGENVLTVTCPVGEDTDIEPCYLLGDFGVRLAGDTAFLTEKPTGLRFGDMTAQGYPFYGGSVTYTRTFTLEKAAAVTFRVPHYRGYDVKIALDGKEAGTVLLPPYEVRTKRLTKGTHEVTFTLALSRYNTLSALHNLAADKPRVYTGPNYWRSEGDEWSYEYHVREAGILSAPTVLCADC